MEETKFRDKVTWFNFICCALVVWNHAGNAELFFPELGTAAPLWYFQYRVMPELVRGNIPCFLMLSGYLFYRNFSLEKLPQKWKRRVHSLLIPYLLWNFLYYMGYLVASQISGLQGVINRAPMTLTAAGAFNAIVRFTYNPVFWFMYQLLILVLLAPVLYLFLRKIWSGLLLLGLLFGALFAGISLPELNLDALLYYSAAGFFALHGKKAAEAAWTPGRALTGAVLLAAGVWVARFYYTSYCVPAIVLCQLAVPMGFWLLVSERRLGKVRPFMTCTFFIYAFHFIPVRFLNKAAAILLPGRYWTAALLFLLMPVIAVFLCWQAARFLQRYLPRVWTVLNGGR